VAAGAVAAVRALRGAVAGVQKYAHYWHTSPTSISRRAVQIIVRCSDFVRLASQARWRRGGTCSYTPMVASTRCALG